MEFTCTNEFLRGDSKFPSMDSDPNNINLTGVDGHIEGSQLVNLRSFFPVYELKSATNNYDI